MVNSCTELIYVTVPWNAPSPEHGRGSTKPQDGDKTSAVEGETHLMYLRLWRRPHQGPLRGPSAECWHIIRVKTLWGSSYSGSAHREPPANQREIFQPELRPLNHLLQSETGLRSCSGGICPMREEILLVLFSPRKLLANHKWNRSPRRLVTAVMGQRRITNSWIFLRAPERNGTKKEKFL